MAAAVAVVLSLQSTAIPGTPVSHKMATPMAETEPFGRATIGTKFSDDIQSGYLDVLQGLYRTQNAALFVNLRGTMDDNNQEIFSAGIGFRYLIEDPGIIIGANAYYDYIDTAFGNGINQLGLGAEILTKWVDARFNYYIPEGDQHLVRSFTRTSSTDSFGPLVLNGNQFNRTVRSTSVTQTFGIFEQGLEGWNAEAGVLIPGLDQWFELRIFAGGYSYDDPKGGDIAGFRARAEARVTEGITLDLEYWEDEELVGGNWVGGIRVSLPFDIGNLFTGKNPFEGAGEMFARPKGDLRSRMDEMVIRSHRVQSGLTNPVPTGSSTTTTTRTLTTTRKVMPPITAPPSDGGNGEGAPEGNLEGFVEFSDTVFSD